MGTNFYLMNGEHVGKRSAAGPYCWDCKRTLNKDGIHGIHTGESEWHKACPDCGREYVPSDISISAVGRELGFNKNEFKEKQGVATCSSFRWAIEEKRLMKIRKIKSEYGDIYSKKEFYEILKECPIYFYSIGQEFY